MHLDVKEFGAAGDGVTDDTIAIQAAVNFPAGAYKISAPIGVPAYTSVLSEHAILEPNAGSIDVFISNSTNFYEMSFRGIVFHGGRNAITVAQAL